MSIILMEVLNEAIALVDQARGWVGMASAASTLANIA